MIEIGSKFISSTIKANAKLYALGCVDGRCMLGTFEDGYNGVRPLSDSSKKMMSKSQKRDTSYSHTPLYSQVNDIDIGIEGNQ